MQSFGLFGLLAVPIFLTLPPAVAGGIIGLYFLSKTVGG